MIKFCFIVFLMLNLSFISIASENDLFEAPRRGVFYYDDAKPTEKKLEPDKHTGNNFTANEWAEQKRKIFNETLNQAIKEPNYQNILKYKLLEQEHLERATNFSNMVKLAVLKNPKLNYALQHPSDHNARTLADLKNEQQIELANQRLARDYGLFFFFTSHCRYCHAFAPTIKRYTDKYKMNILAISIDGGKLDIFPDAVSDNGIAKKLKVTHFPSLYAVNPKTNPMEVVPISYGNISVSSLEENVYFFEKMLKDRNK